MEIEYLKEYHSTMKPFALALNILQSDERSFMGYPLSTIYEVIAELGKIKIG